MKIAWFPGHMKKAIRVIEESISFVDLVLFVLDARIPESSRNRNLENLIKKRNFYLLLNKSDLSETRATQLWLNAFHKEDRTAFALSSKTGSGYGRLKGAIEKQRKKLCRMRREKGRFDEQIRVMVIGIPNVGKSSVINKLAGRAVARAGKKPGVTRGIQWISTSRKIEIIDMPGIFYPHVEEEKNAWHLASVGTVKEEHIPLEEVTLKILEFLKIRRNPFPVQLSSFSISESLFEIGKSLGFFDIYGRVDLRRTSLYILKNFREGSFGRFTLELPNQPEQL